MRSSTRHAITTESQRWVDANIITQQQAEQIRALYPHDSGSRGHGLLTILGYGFIALAVITLIGANWDEIPRALRMLGVIAVTLATQGLALQRLWQGRRESAVALFFLGNMFYGASIILIAQIYHLGEHMPNGVLAWALGCAPFALLLREPWLMLQTLLLAMLWAGLQIGFGYDIFLFPAFLAATLYVLNQSRGSRPLFLLFIVSLLAWLNYLLLKSWGQDYLDPEVELCFFNGALLLAMSALGVRLRALGSEQEPKNAHYGAILLNLSSLALMVVLLVMTFLGPWEELLDAQWLHPYALTVLVVLLGAAAIYLLRGHAALPAMAAIIATYVVTMLAVLLSRNAEHALLFQIVMNLLFVALGIVLLWHGLRSGSSRAFKLGLGSLLLIAYVRYFDLVGNYVGAAALFLVFALLMLGAAQFWKRLHGRVSQ